MNIVQKSMSDWAFEHPSLVKRLSLLMSTFDQNLEIYTLRMEYTDAIGQKYKVAKAVSARVLRAAKEPYNYIYTLLDEMFGELRQDKDIFSHNMVKEKKEMDWTNCVCVKADNDARLKMAKAAVVKWYNEHNQSHPIGIEDVYIVWFCKVLQNWKALAGTHHEDGMYYEITFDGNNELVYFDAYKKWQNVQMEGGKLRGAI